MLTQSVCLKKYSHIKIILKNLIQRKKTKYTPSGYSLFTNCSFDSAENKFHCYKGEDCMERLCKDLREHAMKIINYEKKEMMQLTHEENKYNEMQKSLLHIQKRIQ